MEQSADQVATRARVYRRSSVQPCAAGPRTNATRNRWSWSGERELRMYGGGRFPDEATTPGKGGAS